MYLNKLTHNLFQTAFEKFVADLGTGGSVFFLLVRSPSSIFEGNHQELLRFVQTLGIKLFQFSF